VEEKEIKGSFECLFGEPDADKKEFRLTGRVKEGEIKKGWYVNIKLNNFLRFTVRIHAIHETPVEGKTGSYQVLTISGEELILEVLTPFKLEGAVFEISKEGKN
jgi:hypothetical protein